MIFLLLQEKPLELLSEAWMEHQTVDVGETFKVCSQVYMTRHGKRRCVIWFMQYSRRLLRNC